MRHSKLQNLGRKTCGNPYLYEFFLDNFKDGITLVSGKRNITQAFLLDIFCNGNQVFLQVRVNSWLLPHMFKYLSKDHLLRLSYLKLQCLLSTSYSLSSGFVSPCGIYDLLINLRIYLFTACHESLLFMPEFQWYKNDRFIYCVCFLKNNFRLEGKSGYPYCLWQKQKFLNAFYFEN